MAKPKYMTFDEFLSCAELGDTVWEVINPWNRRAIKRHVDRIVTVRVYESCLNSNAQGSKSKRIFANGDATVGALGNEITRYNWRRSFFLRKADTELACCPHKKVNRQGFCRRCGLDLDNLDEP